MNTYNAVRQRDDKYNETQSRERTENTKSRL
jgi:hypothetical protein